MLVSLAIRDPGSADAYKAEAALEERYRVKNTCIPTGWTMQSA
jgi:hypothetical protein